MWDSGRQYSGNWYDTAQVCLNGHLITDKLISFPEVNAPFCPECGKPTITTCPDCQAAIRGRHHIVNVFTRGTSPVPSFCHNCGKPYPWTEARLAAARELADEMDLTQEEKEDLKANFDDLVRDTPRTQVAAMKVKRLAGKAGAAMASVLRDILVDVASEAAKKVLLGP